ALIFEFWQLRNLLNDLFQLSRISEQLQRAKVSGFSVSFHDNIPWEDLFRESHHLDMMVAYASTWRNAHRSKIEEFLRREDAELTVVLPDPQVPSTMTELGMRFGMSTG